MSSDGFTDFLSLNDQILLMAFFIVQKFFINFFPNFSPKFSKIFSKISIFWWSPKSIIKVGLSPSKTTCLICFIESHLKLLENTFYFILKLFSFSRYLNFCNDFLVMQEKRLDLKDRVNCKIRHNLVNKQLQYTSWPISHEVKTTRQWNSVS